MTLTYAGQPSSYLLPYMTFTSELMSLEKDEGWVFVYLIAEENEIEICKQVTCAPLWSAQPTTLPLKGEAYTTPLDALARPCYFCPSRMSKPRPSYILYDGIVASGS